MRLIESNEPELIREYSKLHKLITDNNIDGFIGTAHGQETLRVFVQKDGKFHMVRFEDTPIIGKHPWPLVDVYAMNNLITIDVTGGKDMYSMGEPILTIKSRQGDPVKYKNHVVFAITDCGNIKIISYDCNEPSFIESHDVDYMEDGEVTDQSMWSKVYQSIFVWDEMGNPQDGDYDGNWDICLESPHCKVLTGLNLLGIKPSGDVLKEHNIKAAIDILKKHNKWRRGDDSIEPTDPTELGNAIDVVVKFTEDRLK